MLYKNVYKDTIYSSYNLLISSFNVCACPIFVIDNLDNSFLLPLSKSRRSGNTIYHHPVLYPVAHIIPCITSATQISRTRGMIDQEVSGSRCFCKYAFCLREGGARGNVTIYFHSDEIGSIFNGVTFSPYYVAETTGKDENDEYICTN